MSDRKKLTRKQLAVIEDLFAGELDETQVLKKHNVSTRVYNKWQADEAFIQQFQRRIAAAYRQSAAIIARYAPAAAAKLVQLTQSEKEETARKACLDIISMHPPSAKPLRYSPATTTNDHAPLPDLPPLSEQAAGKILAILAEENNPSPRES